MPLNAPTVNTPPPSQSQKCVQCGAISESPPILFPVSACSPPCHGRRSGFPTPLTAHDLMEMWPALAPQIPYSPGSSFFHTQERAFFSRDNLFFRVQVDIDVPHTNQALGGSFGQEKGKARVDPPQLFAVLHQQLPPSQQQPSPSSSSSSPSSWNVSPSQYRSPSEHQRTQVPSQPMEPHHSRTIPTNPLLAVGPTNNHRMGQDQVTGHHSQYPYPPPGLEHKSHTIIDESVMRDDSLTPYALLRAEENWEGAKKGRRLI